MLTTRRTAVPADYPLPSRFSARAGLVIIALRVLVLPLLAAPPCSAGGGTLDPTFGTDGIARTGLSSSEQTKVDVTVQADGEILLGGHDDVAGEDFIARFDATGALDTTFGTGGFARTGFASSSLSAVGVTVQGDGKILLAGFDSPTGGGEDFVARFDANGALDATFGADGFARTGFVSISGHGIGVAIQADGKILLAGVRGSTVQAFVARFDATGELDLTFGTDGFTQTGFTSSSAIGVTVQSDGMILLAGHDRGADEDFVARFDATGALDATFGTEGIARIGFLCHPYGVAVTVQGDGKILLAGKRGQLSARDFVARFGATGALDATFGTDGIAWTGFVSEPSSGVGVIVQGDGKILLADLTRSRARTSSRALTRRERWMPCSGPTGSREPGSLALLVQRSAQ